MYKLVIADDEEIIRDGLANLVDWHSLGFEVAAGFEDGKEAVAYILQNPTDVVLTDIKMTFVSGIELAKYMHENKLATRVILISGYKDFEYAKMAISYDVFEYLLKPVSLKDIKCAFSKMKQVLDEENEKKELDIKNRKKHFEIVSLLREQFIVDVVLGALKTRDEIAKRIKLLDLDVEIDSTPCGIVDIVLEDYLSFLEDSWEYGEEKLYTAVLNFLKDNRDSLKFYPVQSGSGKLTVLAAGGKGEGFGGFCKKTELFLDNVSRNINLLLGLKMIHRQDLFENLWKMTSRAEPIAGAFLHESAGERHLQDEEMGRLKQRQKLLITHISDGDLEAVNNIFAQLVGELKPLNIKVVQNYIIELFSMVLNKLADNGIDIYRNYKDGLFYADIARFESVDEIIQWGFAALGNIGELVSLQSEKSQISVIFRAKQYINENYQNDITLEKIADHVFLSPAYFSKLFKEHTGENFIDYLIKIKMDMAADLLKDPKMKVYEVCRKVGYSSIKYFYKLFKKLYGCTPVEYRERITVKENQS